jgi:hypothetical protein
VTPLHAAVRGGHFSVVKVLVEDGQADINPVDKKGRTPYDLSCNNKDMNGTRDKSFFYLASKQAKQGSLVKLEAGKKQNAWKKKKAARPTVARHGGFSGGSEKGDVAVAPAKKKEPKFTEEKLAQIFNPASWVGNTKEMEKLWEDVPRKLQAKFDFVAALSEAKRQSMRKSFAAPKFRPKLG